MVETGPFPMIITDSVSHPIQRFYTEWASDYHVPVLALAQAVHSPKALQHLWTDIPTWLELAALGIVTLLQCTQPSSLCDTPT